MARKQNVPVKSESATPAGDKTIVNFGNPPVTEVVCGIGFRRLANYSTPQMGFFWSQLYDEFPTAEIKAPLVPPGGQIEFSTEFGSLPSPRYFLRNPGRDEVVQLQDTCFLYNWIKTPEKPVYPRYAKVVRRFNKLRNQFQSFLRKDQLGELDIRELRLTYVNHIPQGQGWNTLSDLGKIFPAYRMRSQKRRYLGRATAYNFTVRYPVRDKNSHLEVSIRTATQETEAKEVQTVITFQLAVIGQVVSPSEQEIQGWFDMAREAINLSFLDLTSKEMQQKLWQIDE